jgi:hypothetical protein
MSQPTTTDAPTDTAEPGRALAEFMAGCWDLVRRTDGTIRQSDIDLLGRELAGTRWSVALVDGRWTALRGAGRV